MPRMIDVHFHLDFYKNHEAIYEMINKLEQYTLCMTNSPGVYLSCKNLYAETKISLITWTFPQNKDSRTAV